MPYTLHPDLGLDEPESGPFDVDVESTAYLREHAEAPDRWVLNFGPQHPATHTTLRIVLERVKEPGTRIIEDECLDDESGVRRHVSPYDPANLLKADYSRWRNAAQ